MTRTAGRKGRREPPVCRVLNPAQVAYYARSQLQRVKTDKVDAKLIASYGDKHQRAAYLEARSAFASPLVCRLKDLQELEQMKQNRLDVASAARVVESIRSVLEHIRQQINETLEAIKKHFDDNDDLRGKRDLLRSIDGVADKTAALLLAELGDLARFDGSRAVTAYAGLNPRLQESGKLKAQTRISRTGSGTLRAGLYMPGVVSITHNA